MIHFLIWVCPASLKIKSKESGLTPFLQLFARTDKATEQEVKFFVEEHAVVLQDRNTNNSSALHIAVYYQQPLTVVEFLINKMGSDALMEINKFGSTPLQTACDRKHTSEVTIELLFKAQPVALTFCSPTSGFDPFLTTCKFHSLQLVQKIIESQSQVMGQRYFSKNWCALQVAIFYGYSLELVQLLVKKMGPYALLVRESDGKTLLHLAMDGKKRVYGFAENGFHGNDQTGISFRS
jgi:ankyrin repeat protein